MRGPKILEIRVLGWLTGLVALLFSVPSSGQDASSVRLLEFNFGFQFPMGDLEERFGSSNGLGFAFQTANIEKKLLLGLEGVFFFGSTVKEDVLYDLRTYDGNIIGLDGLPGDVALKERGFYIGPHIAKIFSTGKNKNTLTGIQALAGIGLLQHKIRVQDNFESVVALDKEYLPGYDRLTNGLGMHLGLGYRYDSPINNMHFHIMADLLGAQTESRRDLDFATGTTFDEKRFDVFTGFHIAYVITISREKKPENIYY